ncbi:MAG: leucine-rich repeat domain-containing protein [Alloprevotella sp.]|nr:leucine-rich repeat domain-containing protein [Alloprevotella sp.]
MKKLVLISLAALFSQYAAAQNRVVSSAPQYDYEVDGLFYNRIGDGQAEVTFHDSAACVYYFRTETDSNNPEGKHTYYSGDITVPRTISTADGTLAVTRIGDWAFAYADGVTSITLPEGIRTIGAGAFFRTDLTRLTLPAGLEHIGARAFTGGVVEEVDVPTLADWLRIVFEDTNAQPIWAGGGQLTVGGEALSEVVVPEGTEEIHDFAFGFFQGIKEVSFPTSLRRIGRMAFYLNADIPGLDLPEGLEVVDYGAFNMCSGAMDITLPATLRELGAYAFSGCRASSFYIPASLETIGEFALFQADESLLEISVDRASEHFAEKDGILYTKDMTRLICYPCGKNELEYTMPATLRTVDGSALCNNQYLTRINLSPALQRIGVNGLQTAQEVDLNVTDLAAFCRIQLMDDEEAEFYAPWSNFNLYVNGEPCTDLVIPEGVESIGRMQFIQCQNIQSLTLPSTMKSVRQFAFGLCNNLRKLYINDGLEQMEFYAFAYSPLKEIHTAMTQPFSFVSNAGEQAYASLYNIDPFGSYTATLYVPVGTVETYKNTDGWNAFPLILEDTEENQPKEDVFKEIGRGTFKSAMLGRSYIAILSRSLTNPTHYLIAPFLYNEDGAVFTVSSDGRIYMDNQSTGWDYSGYGIIYASDPHTYGFGTADLGTATLYGDHDFYGTFSFQLTYFVEAGYFGTYTDTFQLEEMTGIRDIRQSDDSSLIYDLQGRSMKTEPQHGIYIRGGRKVLR